MAITSNTFNIVMLPREGNDWYVSLASEDLSGCEAIKAAESTKTHYITRLLIRADAAMDISIGSGGDGGTGVTTVHIGPVPLDAASGIFVWKAPPGMALKCTAALSIAIDSSAGGTVWIEAWGHTSLTNFA